VSVKVSLQDYDADELAAEIALLDAQIAEECARLANMQFWRGRMVKVREAKMTGAES